MYGFIEKWLADQLGLPYEPFTLNSGGEAALINVGNFNMVHQAICAMSVHDAEPLPIEIVRSDIVGTHIVLHKYWSDDDVLDGLTGSEVKQGSLYLAIMGMGRGTSRFDLNWFRQGVGAEYDRIYRGEFLEGVPAQPAEDTSNTQIKILAKILFLDIRPLLL